MIFQTLPPNFVKRSYENWLNFAHFAWMKASKIKLRVNL
jgi:hypothetical protein